MMTIAGLSMTLCFTGSLLNTKSITPIRRVFICVEGRAVEANGVIDGNTLAIESLEMFADNEVDAKGDSEGIADELLKEVLGDTVGGENTFVVGITSAYVVSSALIP